MPRTDEPLDLARAADVLRGARVLFGHQSVGEDLVRGAVAACAEAGVPSPRVVDARAPWPDAPGFVAHARIGTNGDPRGKIADFRSLLAGAAVPPDVAVLKLCYVDVVATTDAEALAADYCRSLEEVAASASTRVLAVTVPLTTPASPVRRVKDTLRRRPGSHRDNQARERFNTVVRSRFPSSLLFDLAAEESTRGDGRRVVSHGRGGATPALAPEHASDEGHLDDPAAARVGGRWLAAVARAVSG